MPPVIGNPLSYRISLTRIINRRFENIRPGEPSETLMQLRPAIYGARDRGRVDPCAEIRYSLAFEEIDGQCFGSPATGIQAVELFGFGVPVENHQITADAVHHRLHHTDHGVRGDRGISC